jgi:hypothetical protein
MADDDLENEPGPGPPDPPQPETCLERMRGENVSPEMLEMPPAPTSQIDAIEDPLLRQRARDAWNTVHRLVLALWAWGILLFFQKSGISIDDSCQARITRVLPEFRELRRVLDSIAFRQGHKIEPPDDLMTSNDVYDHVCIYADMIEHSLVALDRIRILPGPDVLEVTSWSQLLRKVVHFDVTVVEDFRMTFDEGCHPRSNHLINELMGYLAVFAVAPAASLLPREDQAPTRGTSALDTVKSSDGSGNQFKLHGKVWHLRYTANGQSESSDYTTWKGLAYYALLIDRPDEYIEAVDLVRRIDGTVPPVDRVQLEAAMSAGVEYQVSIRRSWSPEDGSNKKKIIKLANTVISNLTDELHEAEQNRDLEEAEAVRKRIENARSDIKTAMESDRGNPSEKARKSVYKAINDSIEKISNEMPMLSSHMKKSLMSGHYSFAYMPTRPRPHWNS